MYLDEFHLKKYLHKITGCFRTKEKEIEEELVRYQKKKETVPKEKAEIIYSSSYLWNEERKRGG